LACRDSKPAIAKLLIAKGVDLEAQNNVRLASLLNLSETGMTAYGSCVAQCDRFVGADGKDAFAYGMPTYYHGTAVASQRG
jgi:hypothetical protein